MSLFDPSYQSFGFLYLSDSAFAEFLVVGERGLRISEGVMKPTRPNERYGNVVAYTTGDEDITGLFVIPNGFLVVLECAIGVASLTVNISELVAGNCARADVGLRCQFERLLGQLCRFSEVKGKLLRWAVGCTRFQEAQTGKFAELAKRISATRRIGSGE